MPTPTIMHGDACEHMEAQPPMGLKGGSGDGSAIISGSEQGAGRGRVRM